MASRSHVALDVFFNVGDNIPIDCCFQVMYMYYLLGFRIVRMCQETVTTALNEGKINALSNWDGDDSGRVFKSHIFRAFDDTMIQKV